MTAPENVFRFPGERAAMDGNTAVIMCERESSDAAGAYPITPSTQMGEYWAEEVANGHLNVSDRTLIFVEPESEHAAAAVTAGMAMTGLRATNFSSAQGVAFMHESLCHQEPASRFVAERCDEVEHIAPETRAKRSERFVQQDQVRGLQQNSCERHAGQLSAG